MRDDDIHELMSVSAEWIIKMVCDGDYQRRMEFPRKFITIGQVLEQYDDIRVWKGDEA